MTCLIIKSGGKVYVNDFPEPPWLTAIECADQEYAKTIIKEKFGHDLDLMTINTEGYQYPIPGLTFEIQEQPCDDSGIDGSGPPYSKIDFKRVAILHYESELTGENPWV